MITKHRKILNTIALLRESHKQMEEIFLYGSCLNLFCILRSIFPEAKPYFKNDESHIITKIDNKFYDITGVVDPSDYIPFLGYYSNKSTIRAFTQMYNCNAF